MPPGDAHLQFPLFDVVQVPIGQGPAQIEMKIFDGFQRERGSTVV